MRVLHIEDNENVALSVRELYGHAVEIEHVHTLCGAKYRLEHERFDVLLVDLNLADSQGEATVRQLARFGIPIVVLAADSSARQVEAAAACGADDYVAKSRLTEVDLIGRLQFVSRKTRLSRGSVSPFADIESLKRYIAMPEFALA